MEELPQTSSTSIIFCLHTGHIAKFPFLSGNSSSSWTSIFIISHDLIMQIYHLFSIKTTL
nr:MAG TPA: hypothetical protein [Caudoviricetes sp.]